MTSLPTIPPNTGTQPLAASYARKSTRDTEGIDAQHLAAAHRAQKHAFRIPAGSAFHFEDDDTAGTTRRRKGFDRLLDLVTNGEAPFKRVYVKDKTRLGRWRDPRYHTYLEVLFEQHGVTICYGEDEHAPIDYENADPGEFLGRHLKGQIDNIMASEERLRLARRVAGGMRKRVADGYYPGSRAPYATRRSLINKHTGRVELAEIPFGSSVQRQACHIGLTWATDGTVQVVRRIFDLAEQGHSMRGIARRLNEEGIPSPLAVRHAEEATRPWLGSTVYDILRNPIYCGDLLWGRTTRGHLGAPVDARTADLENGKEPLIAIDFMCDPPIRREQWFAVQTPLEDNRAVRRSRASRPDYLLTGLLRCASCGAPLHGFTKRRSRGYRRYYRHDCKGRAEIRPQVLACEAKNRYVLAEELESAVRTTFEHVLSDGRIADLTRQELARHFEQGHSEERQARLREARSAAEAVEREYLQAGRRAARAKTDVEQAMFDQVVAEIEGGLRVLKLEVEALEQELVHATRAQERVPLSLSACEDLIAALERASPAERKRLLAEVVEQVRLDLRTTPDGVDQAEVLVRSL